MRTILFFDLPTLTSSDLKEYRKFVKLLKQTGFYMIQESVYVKMSLDLQVVDGVVKKIKNYLPPKGNIIVLNITEKQFSNIQILQGDSKSDVVSSDSRVIKL